jgi:hypothetical protein
MEDESKTVDGRRRWQHWTEEQARAALEELAGSGVSIARFAASKGVSAQRIAYWKKRLAESVTPRFVGVDVSTAVTSAGGRIEVLLDGITLRIPEGANPERVADLIDALTRARRGC